MDRSWPRAVADNSAHPTLGKLCIHNFGRAALVARTLSSLPSEALISMECEKIDLFFIKREP